MTRAIPAVFRDGQVRPLVPLDLPENTRLEIVVLSQGLDAQLKCDADPLASLGDIAADLGPTDLARRLDCYLYGMPREE